MDTPNDPLLEVRHLSVTFRTPSGEVTLISMIVPSPRAFLLTASKNGANFGWFR